MKKGSDKRSVLIDNRYKILKKLGVGAIGEVYKVRDLKDKRIIALKILSKDRTSSEAVQRFKREFRLLAEFHHPNLCSVYDFGMLKNGGSYFTLEYIDGPNILAFTKKLSYEKIYHLIVQLCRVLEYIHSKGLLHYDIKPGNVLIQISTDSGDNSIVKLMDFGLAGERRIKGGVMIRGTFPYIAPELIKGLAVDHRVDLYSLGVLLYEVFTRRSFQKGKESFATLLKQRIEGVPEPPSKIVSDIPKVLERLIVRLLAFEPAARFSRANEIIKEINKLSRSRFEFETERTLESYLLSSRFVGRGKEMSILKSLYDKACNGKGKVILVTGDAGIGKSRLLKEFKIFVQLQRSHCFTGACYRDKIGPLEPFYEIFRELMNQLKSKHKLSRKLKFSFAVLFKIFPDLEVKHMKKILPELVPLEQQQEKLRNFEELSELIRYSASSLGELVILLEDLHWADDLSIQFLEYLSRNLEDRNIFICGTCRKEELKGNLVLKRMMTNLKKEDCLSQIELGPLRFRSLYSFLDSTVTSGSNSSELVRYLMKKTGGNPFFVQEIMRTLLQMRKVNIGEHIEIEHFKRISIPETIEEIVLKRIKGLDSTSQKVVKFGAVLLKDFSYGLMKRLTGLDDAELSRTLWKLKRRQVLIEDGNRYRFYHATLREAINKRITYREKRKLYYQSGKTLELINRRNTEGVVEDLAYYFINAKDRKKGIKYGLQASKKSRERYATKQATVFYKGVLDLLDEKDIKRRFNILQELAEIEALVGYHDDAIETYSKSIRMEVGSVYKKIKIYSSIGSIYDSKGEYNNALQTYKRCKKLLKRMKPGKFESLLETYFNVRICLVYQKIGNYKSVNKYNFNVAKFPKDDLKGKEARRLLASIYNALGIIEYNKREYSMADYDRAIFYYNKAYKYYRIMKYETGIVAVLTNIGLCYAEKRDLRREVDYYQKSLRVSEKTGNQYSVSLNLLNLGVFFYRKQYSLMALDFFQKTLSISKKIGNHLVTGCALTFQARCFLNLCDYKRVHEYLKRASKIYDTLGMKWRKSFLILDFGRVSQAQGNYTLALKFYRSVLKISKEKEDLNLITILYLLISSVFIEIGELLKARKYIEEAFKIVTDTKEKENEIVCYIELCRFSIIMGEYRTANHYCQIGIKVAKEFGMKRQLLQFFLLGSRIYYHERKYLKGIKNANKAIKLAKKMGTKDLYAEALLIKAKNEIMNGDLSRIEILTILNKAKNIGEAIGCPEVLWKVYFEYGKFLQGDKQYLRALEYYEKCHRIFMDVGGKIKNESYRHSYLDRPDRQAVFTAIREIKKLVQLV